MSPEIKDVLITLTFLNFCQFSIIVGIRQSEIRRESDGNNQGNKKKRWLGDDAPVFPQALSAWLLFLDLSFLWHFGILLLSVASCADGLGTVLGLQLRGYQVERGGRGEGEKKGERKKERERHTEGGRIQPSILGNMLKDKHGSFHSQWKHSKSKHFRHIFLKGLQKQRRINQLQSFRPVLSFYSNSQVCPLPPAKSTDAKQWLAWLYLDMEFGRINLR